MDISVVIPLFNEEESLPELYDWIARVMQANNFTYEVIFMNDGSTDKSWEVIQDLGAAYPQVRGIRFRKNQGKSNALNVGFKQAQGDVVITMDADLQDSPEEIPELYSMIMKDGFDLVSGWKKKRYDPITKTIPTKLFNWATRKISDIKLQITDVVMLGDQLFQTRSISPCSSYLQTVFCRVKGSSFTDTGTGAGD